MIVALNPFPVLTTDRLMLRALTMADSAELFRLRSDERVNRYLGRPVAASEADAQAFIGKIEQLLQKHAGVYWATGLKDNPALIGTVCYWNFNTEKDMADIGYELMPEYQGQGLMQEALAKVISYGFDMMQLKTITALLLPDNQPSIKVLKRNGFVLDDAYEFVSKEDAGDEVVYVLTR